MRNLEVAMGALIPNSRFLLPTSRFLLLRLLFSTCRPVLLHALGYGLASRGRHPFTPARRRAFASGLPSAARNQIRKRPADHGFLLTQLLQTLSRANPRQPSQLHSHQLGHKPSQKDTRRPNP